MTSTRPDISFAVGQVCRHMADPGPAHWTAVKRILRYLKGTIKYQIQYSKTIEPLTLGPNYTDSNFSEVQSTTGYVFYLCGGPVTWRSRKQETIAFSTTEAEYMAISDATREALWLRYILEDLQHTQHTPTIIYNDNNGAVCLTKNPTFHHRTKHIERRHHHARAHVENKTIKIVHKRTQDMVADTLTKALRNIKFHEHAKALFNTQG